MSVVVFGVCDALWSCRLSTRVTTLKISVDISHCWYILKPLSVCMLFARSIQALRMFNSMCWSGNILDDPAGSLYKWYNARSWWLSNLNSVFIQVLKGLKHPHRWEETTLSSRPQTFPLVVSFKIQNVAHHRMPCCFKVADDRFNIGDRSTKSCFC